MKTILIVLLLLFNLCSIAFTQEVYNYQLKGDRFYFSYNYTKAIEMYLNARNLSIQAKRKLADSYQQTNQTVEAEKVYLTIIHEVDGLIPEDYYNYAMICKINGHYTASKEWMQKFAQLQPNDLRAIDYILNRASLNKLIYDSSMFSIKNLAMNSDALDFGTSYFNHSVVYASSRTMANTSKRKYNWTSKPFWTMYISEQKDGELKKPFVFDENLTTKLNDGPASFSMKDTYMAFTRNQTNNKRKDRTVELEIHFSKLENNVWSKPIPFYLNNMNYSVGHPCLSQDGNMMLFASDMPGGYGKADIYIIRKNSNGDWENPINLGNTVNTEGDDMFPFISENNETLYFASDGHFGLGGLDIFKCTIKDQRYSNVVNLGSPVNSNGNDYGFIFNAKSGTGFFSSDRKTGKGGDDIYAVQIADSDIDFNISTPKKIHNHPNIREFFPIRNYVFFNPNETFIANRYALLKKEQVSHFIQEQLSDNTDKDLATRAKRQLLVYYNLLNILGARMHQLPAATITLVGSSENGPTESLLMAKSVKSYLTDVFGIHKDRIYIEGRTKPVVPSEQPGGIIDLKLLQEGDRRVTIETNFHSLLKEFEIESSQLNKFASADAYPYTFSVTSVNQSIQSWSMLFKDNENRSNYFGPYTKTQIILSQDSIVGKNLPTGHYRVLMTALTYKGVELTRNAEFDIEPIESQLVSDILRFSIIFEFDDDKSVQIYKAFLTDIVAPKIPYGATVVLNGYTDIIGQDAHNNALSLRRMESVKLIMESVLYKAGRNDVLFDVHWHGGNTVDYPFSNQLPEERFYNRTVFIDIIPRR